MIIWSILLPIRYKNHYRETNRIITNDLQASGFGTSVSTNFDGSIVVDRNLKTNDSFIFCAGPCLKFKASEKINEDILPTSWLDQKKGIPVLHGTSRIRHLR